MARIGFAPSPYLTADSGPDPDVQDAALIHQNLQNILLPVQIQGAQTANALAAGDLAKQGYALQDAARNNQDQVDSRAAYTTHANALINDPDAVTPATTLAQAQGVLAAKTEALAAQHDTTVGALQAQKHQDFNDAVTMGLITPYTQEQWHSDPAFQASIGQQVSLQRQMAPLKAMPGMTATINDLPVPIGGSSKSVSDLLADPANKLPSGALKPEVFQAISGAAEKANANTKANVMQNRLDMNQQNVMLTGQLHEQRLQEALAAHAAQYEGIAAQKAQAQRSGAILKLSANPLNGGKTPAEIAAMADDLLGNAPASPSTNSLTAPAAPAAHTVPAPAAQPVAAPAVVNSKADLDSLPVGSPYTWNGQHFVKR